MNAVLGLQKLPVSAPGYLSLASNPSVTCSAYSTGGCTTTTGIF